MFELMAEASRKDREQVQKMLDAQPPASGIEETRARLDTVIEYLERQPVD